LGLYPVTIAWILLVLHLILSYVARLFFPYLKYSLKMFRKKSRHIQ
jgi:hypothetical protein